MNRTPMAAILFLKFRPSDYETKRPPDYSPHPPGTASPPALSSATKLPVRRLRPRERAIRQTLMSLSFGKLFWQGGNCPPSDYLTIRLKITQLPNYPTIQPPNSHPDAYSTNAKCGKIWRAAKGQFLCVLADQGQWQFAGGMPDPLEKNPYVR